MPKTAGTSVLAFLEASVGPEAVRRDYRGGPAIEGGMSPLGLAVQRCVDALDRRRLRRDADTIAVVHGHFRASKYADLETRLIAWVRDPVERVASHYAHFVRHPEKNRHADAVRAGLGLVDFAARPGLRDLQARYLDVPLKRFTFVGRMEYFTQDLERMADALGLPPRPPEMANRNPGRPGDAYSISDDDRARIRALNRRDVELIERIGERFGA